MPRYHFTATVDTEVADTELALEFDSPEEARNGARMALAQIVAAKLAASDHEFISVEVFDEFKTPITELRVEFREIRK